MNNLEKEIIENLEIAKTGLNKAQDLVLYNLIKSYSGERYEEFMNQYLIIKEVYNLGKK